MTYLPKGDGPLLNWGSNFEALVSVNFAQYGLSAAQAADYTAAFHSYRDAFIVATHPPTRTTPSIIAKNEAKKVLVSLTRELVKIVQAFPGTTNEMRGDLNITIRDVEPTPVPPPAHPPLLIVSKRYQRTVELLLRDSQNPNSKKKPDGVSGLTLFSWVGEMPPVDIATWKFEGNTGKMKKDVTFPLTVPLCSKVWFTAFWFNPTKQSGPASKPVSAFLDNGMDEMEEAA